MPEDRMLREIPADYDSRLSDKVMLPSGRVHWPELFYARPVGCRALTLDLFAPGERRPLPHRDLDPWRRLVPGPLHHLE